MSLCCLFKGGKMAVAKIYVLKKTKGAKNGRKFGYLGYSFASQ